MRIRVLAGAVVVAVGLAAGIPARAAAMPPANSLAKEMHASAEVALASIKHDLVDSLRTAPAAMGLGSARRVPGYLMVKRDTGVARSIRRGGDAALAQIRANLVGSLTPAGSLAMRQVAVYTVTHSTRVCTPGENGSAISAAEARVITSLRHAFDTLGAGRFALPYLQFDLLNALVFEN